METRPGRSFSLEVQPRIPARLARLEELADNLWYSWHRPTRALFARLNPALWQAVGYSPKAFLKSVNERQLEDAAEDPAFLHDFNQTLAAYDAYHNQPEGGDDGEPDLGKGDLVAYFCAEFGFHESLPIYSGGLGILAGDHCKTASDMGLPFVAMGLLYRQGYFQQSIDAEGNQHAVYNDSHFGDLPIAPVRVPDGRELEVRVEFGDRDVHVKVWQAKVGRVMLYLLDTDLPSNRPEERATAHRLYGGDRDTRIKQEIVLGVGGVRALAAMGIEPTVWHINEGHAAFLVVERMRAKILGGMDAAAALEAVASNTVFTTHTAVAAGHDHFAEEMVVGYFERYCREIRWSLESLLALGRTHGSGFNMTALAARGSRYQNGVSRIHAGVSARLLADLWPQVPIEESPVRYVTNGVHVESFLAPDWADHFDRFVSGWTRRLHDPVWMEGIEHMPDHMYWSIRQQLKSRMLNLVRGRVRAMHFRNHGSEAHLDRLLRYADPTNPNVLTIGFGRRFATYKRATLLFSDEKWLREILGDEERPVLFLFSGKAHPADEPGKDMIRRVMQVAAMPEYEGKILFVEGYDLRLARRLVSGVDVWLNNPIYPLEASGTSGMKAAFNGVINLSVTDGWWDEGYDGDNGWAIKPASEKLDDARRAHEESRSLYELLQDRAIPLYYSRGPMGYSPEWVRLSKRSMRSLLPRFNSHRMVGEYVKRFYLPAAEQGRRYRAGDAAIAREVAAWKERVRRSWPAMKLEALDFPGGSIRFGDKARFVVGAALDGLSASDVVIELLVASASHELEETAPPVSQLFAPEGDPENGVQRFTLDLEPELSGKLDLRIRAYPSHPALTHRFEMGLMKWL